MQNTIDFLNYPPPPNLSRHKTTEIKEKIYQKLGFRTKTKPSKMGNVRVVLDF